MKKKNKTKLLFVIVTVVLFLPYHQIYLGFILESVKVSLSFSFFLFQLFVHPRGFVYSCSFENASFSWRPMSNHHFSRFCSTRVWSSQGVCERVRHGGREDECWQVVPCTLPVTLIVWSTKSCWALANFCILVVL